MTLPFSAVAFDMDGTFLRDDKSFDQARFFRILDTLQAQGVHVIVASGDPAQVLLPYFGDRQNELTVVAENGAQVIDHGQEILTRALDRQLAGEVVAYLDEELQIAPTLAGRELGYFPPHPSQAFLDHMAFYYPHHVILDQLLPLPDDDFFQISFLVDDEAVPALKADLDQRFGGRLVITPSGNGSMDLTTPGINKGWALQQLLDQWGLTGANLIAFGDGNNDESMLQLAQYSYAMPNASDLIKATAKFAAPADNNHDGVLGVLDSYLEQ